MSAPELPLPEYLPGRKSDGDCIGQQIPISSNRELTWEERLSPDAFWVLDHLQGIGPTKHLRKLAELEAINFEAGLVELRMQGLLNEKDPEYIEATMG